MNNEDHIVSGQFEFLGPPDRLLSDFILRDFDNIFLTQYRIDLYSAFMTCPQQ